MSESTQSWAIRNEQFVTRVQRWLGVLEDGKAGPATAAAFAERTGAASSPPALAIDRSLRLPPGQYCLGAELKDLVVLHHTAGASGRSTIDWWRTTPERIGTAYLVERDGTVREVFPPSEWAYHLGLRGTGGAVDRRSIGVEIACEGALLEDGGRLYAFGQISERTEYRGEVYDHGSEWRGHRYFAAYTEAAIASVAQLVAYLLERFEIRPWTTAAHRKYSQALLEGAKGVLGHHHLRQDKTDLHPGFPWERLVEAVGLEVTGGNSYRGLGSR